MKFLLLILIFTFVTFTYASTSTEIKPLNTNKNKLVKEIQQPLQTCQKNQVVALILNIIFGTFGADYFYL